MNPTKNSLSNEAFVLFVGNASMALANLIVGMILVRYLVDKSVFATYSQSMFLATTLVAFIPLGLHRAVIYFFPRIEDQKAFVIQTTIIISTIMLIAGLMMVSWREHIGNWLNNPMIVEVVPLIFGIMWMQNFNSILQQVLLATKRPRLLGVLMVVYNIIYVATIAVVVRLRFDVYGILGSIMWVSMILAALTVFFTLKLPGRFGNVLRFDHTVAQFKYSLPLALGSFTGVIGKSIDRLIVMSLFSPAVFAVYDRGAIELPFLFQLPYSANSVIQPHLTAYFKDNKIEDFVKLWHKAIRKLALVMLPVMVFALVVAKQLVVIVNTDSYQDSIVYFRIYLLLIPFQITVYPAILMATGHTGRIFWITTSALFVNLAINVFLVEVLHFGPMGPAISTVIVEGCKAVLFLLMISRVLKIPFDGVYPWKELAMISLTALAAGVACYPITFLHLNNFLMLFLVGISYCGAFLAFGLLLKSLEWNDVLDVKYTIFAVNK